MVNIYYLIMHIYIFGGFKQFFLIDPLKIKKNGERRAYDIQKNEPT